MENGEILFFGEVHEKIRILNLVIKPSVHVSGPDQQNHEHLIQLTVNKDGISILRGKSELKIPFKGFSVQPLSAQSMSVVNGDEIHLRFQISSFVNQVSTPLGEKWDLEELLTDAKEERVLNIQCKKCQSAITHKDRTFSRVTELPSENWQEYLDYWCCHGNDAVSKLKGSLNPQLQDCFLGSWYMLVHPQAVATKNIEITKEGSVFQMLCKRCQGVLGELTFHGDLNNTDSHDLDDSESVKLYKHSVSLIFHIGGTPVNIFRDFAEEIYIARKVCTLTKRHLCHKFIVNGTRKKSAKVTSFALMWILNTDAKFLTSCHHNKGSRESTYKEEYISALKVLYMNYLDQNFGRMKDEWYGSKQTDVVTFPEEICLKLLLTLNQNTQAQPPSMRHAYELNVSFLKLQ